MPRRPTERIRRLRIVVRYFMDHGLMQEGTQSFLARKFDLTRQRVNQIVGEERARRDPNRYGDATEPRDFVSRPRPLPRQDRAEAL